MKYKKILILFLSVILLLSGCASNTKSVEAGYKNGFMFKYKDINICLGEYTDNILSKKELETVDYYEYQSCSFEGMSKIYSYAGFNIDTYLNDKSDKDRIYSIELLNDSVKTPEGINIGKSVDDMIAAYGAEYEESDTSAKFYKYTKSGTVLYFGTENNIITSILYQIEDIYN